jgi:hypothetical protein
VTSLLLESRRRSVLADVAGVTENLPHRVALMLAVIIVCGGIYGAILGLWHGPRLSLYVAAKIPILLITTAVLTSLFNFVASALLGLRLRYRQVFAMTLFPLAIAALIAASVAPALWLFTTSLPPPSPSQQTLHNLMYLLHVGVIGAAGFAGVRSMPALARNVRLIWIAIYAFVGGEIAWILRPFVGSVYLPVAFIRDDAFRGNVYEFIVTDIVPHLLGGACQCSGL